MQKLNEILSPNNRILAHFLFWLVYVLFSIISVNSTLDDYTRSFSFVISTLPVKAMAVYFSLYFIIPRFLDTKKYITLGLFFVISGIVFGYLNRLSLHVYYVPTYQLDYPYDEYPFTHIGKAIRNAFTVFTVVFAAVTIKLIKRNYQQEKEQQELAKERLDAELKFLKGQIHPHFLFNTLNNLYSITLQDSPRASEVVLKLSNLLDYMLYEANGAQVPLRKEIEQMLNLIELEKLRYGDRLLVDISTSGDIQNKSIPPLLMLPFVENAFKHGVSKNIESSFISIDINIKGDRLNLRVENSKTEEDTQKAAGYTKGIGLKNVRRRLELIYGPKNYELQVFDQEEDTFMTVLKVPLFMNGLPNDKKADLKVPQELSV